MQFKTNVTVEGNVIRGKILNNTFELTHITPKRGILPPLTNTFHLSEHDLIELIKELNAVKDKMFSPSVAPK